MSIFEGSGGRRRWLMLATLVLGCGGSTDQVADGGTGADAACNTDSGTIPAGDGCNTCTCHAGTLVCTDLVCPTACTPGETKPAGDGCNTCACTAERKWSCTLIACPMQCTPGQSTPPGTCPPCTCSNEGRWGCALILCPVDAGMEGGPPRDVAPVDDAPPRDVAPVDDGPSHDAASEGDAPPRDSGPDARCTFDSNTDAGFPGAGFDAGRDIPCGTKPCGARAGDTCTADEFCAYQEGQHCGAADAQSTCQPLPPGCNFVYRPVCGCDQKTYGNACIAALARTGVLKSGPCEVAPPPDGAAAHRRATTIFSP
jgi:hypothetical protein